MNLASLFRLRWIHGAALAALLPLGMQAQQDPMYTMYMWNMMAIDPAYAGSSDVLNVTALTRMQWTGVQGAPVTHSLSGHAPIHRRSLGLGLCAVHDRIGRTSTTSAFVDLAYRMRVSRTTRLAFGLKAGLNHAQIANTQVEHTDANDPTFMADISGKPVPNFGFGMYLWSSRGYMGASVPKLLRNYLGTPENGNLGLVQESPHAFLIAGYVFALSAQTKFKPSIMVKASEGAPVSPDISATFFFMDRFHAGMAYRNSDSFSALLSIQANDQWRIGYAHDFGVSKLATRSGGSHEILISYDPVFNNERIRSPRYF